ncbi:MAG: single-stranded DNA-binding protein [Chitinophagaceae bacterium]|nr:single-stranded DNA-binding protein [Chitinophagaceae bacterium]
MSGLNKVTLIGHLGGDPEVRRLDSGRTVANFSLATSEKYKKENGEEVTNTEWHRVVVWSPLAEIAEKYLKKGSQVYVEGKLKTREYEAKDGTKRKNTEIEGKQMLLLGKSEYASSENKDSYSSKSESTSSYTDTSNTPDNADDLPF